MNRSNCVVAQCSASGRFSQPNGCTAFLQHVYVDVTKGAEQWGMVHANDRMWNLEGAPL